MYLIYVTARDDKSEASSGDSKPDLQPIMLALTRDRQEYLLREADTRKIKNDKPEGFTDIDRVFVSLTQQTEDRPGGLESADIDELEDSIDEGTAQMAVALASVAFEPGQTQPADTDFVEHVSQRIRLADKLVVAGYTDPDCSMTESERLSLERAMTVRRILLANGVKIPIIAIGRPRCCFHDSQTDCRRAEITALFSNERKEEDEADDRPDKTAEKDDKPAEKDDKPAAKDDKPDPSIRNLSIAAGLLVALALVAPEAYAGTSGNEFDAVVTKLTSWATGSLGEAISLSAVLVGAVVSVIRSNPLPILSGIAFAIILNFTPGVVTGLLTTTL